jgi:hypothetical protein
VQLAIMNAADCLPMITMESELELLLPENWSVEHRVQERVVEARRSRVPPSSSTGKCERGVSW